MQYSFLAKAYEALESTSKRLEMIDILVQLFKETPTDIIDKVIFLTQGKLHPSWFELPVIGIAEKSAIKAVARATNIDEDKIDKKVKKIGDLGSAFKEIISIKRSQKSLTDFGVKKKLKKPLTIKKVYSKLDNIAKASGSGSSDFKIENLAELIRIADAVEGKWILRTVLGKLRFGVADATILDALAITFTEDKKNKQLIERSYNIHPNLGEIAKLIANEGLEVIKQLKIEIFTPVRMMLAQRLSSIEEILEKLGSINCACEFKYDGERLQIHLSGDKVRLYTRNLENATTQYPDVCDLIHTLKISEVVIEGEIVSVDPVSGDLRPFQELMHRRRKYKIDEAIEKYPICLFLFDILKKDEQDLLDEPYKVRRKYLEELVVQSDYLRLATTIISDKVKEIESFFNNSIESGCEGIIAKSINSKYSAGARGWSWIKLKESYQSKMVDSIDVVIVGAYIGRGRRAQTYGALLCAVLDKNDGKYKTICKVGSGFSDDMLSDFVQKFEKIKRKTKSPQVVTSSIDIPDVWFDPNFIIEILGDEITISNVHSAGFNIIKVNSGLAIRFPRFIRWRDDKSIDDITTTDEVIEMYKRQRKQV
ncbi:MAG: ATP-dependent DNA ligase [Promethearchaeota archaeon]